MLLFACVAGAATYYASPNGGGDGKSEGAPFKIINFWSVAQPGDTLLLLDGIDTFSGDRFNLIVPPKAGDLGRTAPLSGTAEAPIAIKAKNDGKVLVDAQCEPWVRPISSQRGCNWIVVEGVNVKGGYDANIVLAADHWVVRRVVGYGASPVRANDNLYLAGTNNVVEDCAFFGTARKQVETCKSGGAFGGNVLRRCWGRFEGKGTETAQPTSTFELGYGQGNTIYENIIGTWKSVGRITDTEGVFREFACPDMGTPDSGWYGSIAYQIEADDYPGRMVDMGTKHNDYPPITRNFTAKEIVSYLSPANSGKGGFSVWGGDGQTKTWHNNRIVDCVAIGGKGSHIDTANWYLDDENGDGKALIQGATVADVVPPDKTIFDLVPGIGYRYVNGVRTTEPLWPWPMDQRIYDALKEAVDVNGKPYELFYVTQVIESMFGPIPAKYRSDKLR
jgi:hypothetical protein